MKVKELKTKNDTKAVQEVREMNDTNGKQNKKNKNKKNKKNKKNNDKETTQPTISAQLPTTGSKNSATSYSPKSTTSTIKQHNSIRSKDTRPHVPVEAKTSAAAAAASSIYCSREWLISYNSKYAQKTHDEDIHALSCHPESFEIVMSKLFNAIDPPGAPGMVAKTDPPAPPGMTPKY